MVCSVPKCGQDDIWEIKVRAFTKIDYDRDIEGLYCRIHAMVLLEDYLKYIQETH